jgi:signal recognition particle subunit SEC65
MDDTKFIEVYRAQNSIDAHLIKNALGDAGISAQITEESMAAMRPNLWWASPKLLVADTDAEKATAIIREIEASRPGQSHSG